MTTYIISAAMMLTGGCNHSSEPAAVTKKSLVTPGTIVYQARGTFAADVQGKLLGQLPITCIPEERVAFSATDQIAYAAKGEPGSSICVLTSDNKPILRITGSYDREPSFTPDGAILFTRATKKEGAHSIFRFEFKSMQMVQLTTEFEDRAPVAGKGGKSIFFTRASARPTGGWSNARLMRMDLSDKTPKDITPPGVRAIVSLSCTPDGDTIFFSAAAEGPRFHIYSMSLKSPSKAIQLTSDEGFDDFGPVPIGNGNSFAYTHVPGELGTPKVVIHIQGKPDVIISEPDPEPHSGVALPSVAP